jgi:hypothetical protein
MWATGVSEMRYNVPILTPVMSSCYTFGSMKVPNREHYKNSQTSQTLVAFLVRFTLHVRETSLFFHIKLYSGYTCVLITVSTPVNLI